MAANQQFCLRWNNHMKTLLSVFDSLLENQTLVDCTLAAEGQYLNAHKVVLSACSPYLGVLLSSHHEKHPILILKDVKFQELKAMLDYMYRGEVNISQEQLCTFLKAAESLQIKGLTESAGLNPDAKDFEERHVKRYERKCTASQIPNHNTRTRSPPSSNAVNTTSDHSWNSKYSSSNYRSTSPTRRDGSLSPTARKRRKQQHPMSSSVEDASNTPTTTATSVPIPVMENHQDTVDNVSSSNSNTLPSVNVNNIKTENLDKVVDTETRSTDSGNSSTTNSTKANDLPVVPKQEPRFEDRHSDIEGGYEDSVEEMTIEDEEEEIDETDLSRPGPSHSEDSQNYGSSSYPLSSVNDGASGQLDCQADQFIMMNDDSYHWPGMDEEENEIFCMSSTSPLKAALSKPPLSQIPDLMQNSTSKSDSKFITCSKCGRQYKLKSSLLNHQRWECGKEPQFKCVLCNYKAKQKVHLVTHMRYKHSLKPEVFASSSSSSASLK